MNPQDLFEQIDQLVETVQQDPDLEDDFKSDFVDLAAQVTDDPSPENLRALSLVVEKLGKAERYVNALAIVKGV